MQSVKTWLGSHPQGEGCVAHAGNPQASGCRSRVGLAGLSPRNSARESAETTSAAIQHRARGTEELLKKLFATVPAISVHLPARASATCWARWSSVSSRLPRPGQAAAIAAVARQLFSEQSPAGGQWIISQAASAWSLDVYRQAIDAPRSPRPRGRRRRERLE
jgi:hypothetical protein